jgi:alpha-1,6-mannosyltransferase
VTAAAPASADAIFLPDATVRTSRLDLSNLELPSPLRPGATRSVLDITEFYGETTGGIRTYLRQKALYVEALSNLRQVLVLPGPRDALSQGEGVRCYRLQGPRVPTQDPYRFMLATRTNRRIALHERPDVIEVGSPGFVPWIVRLAARGLEIPVVAFYHSNFPRVFSPFPERATAVGRAMFDLAWRYARIIDRHFAHTIVSSEFVANDLRRAGIDRVTRIPLGVDLAHFRPSRRPRGHDVRAAYGLPDGPLAAFVGRFSHEKELDVLLDGWREAHRRTGALLALVGDGPMRARLVAQADGAPWVRFLPYEKDRDRLADLLAAIDLFVAPSSNETFGLAPLEALASGTPVLSADRGGIAEQVAASGAGACFASGESHSLAEEAVLLLRSDLAGLGLKARAYAEKDHSWESVFDRIFALYDSVAKR